MTETWADFTYSSGRCRRILSAITLKDDADPRQFIEELTNFAHIAMRAHHNDLTKVKRSEAEAELRKLAAAMSAVSDGTRALIDSVLELYISPDDPPVNLELVLTAVRETKDKVIQLSGSRQQVESPSPEQGPATDEVRRGAIAEQGNSSDPIIRVSDFRQPGRPSSTAAQTFVMLCHLLVERHTTNRPGPRPGPRAPFSLFVQAAMPPGLHEGSDMAGLVRGAIEEIRLSGPMVVYSYPRRRRSQQRRR